MKDAFSSGAPNGGALDMGEGSLVVRLNMPPLTTSRGLPPYELRGAFLVDDLIAKGVNVPEGWMRSEGRMRSYVVPIVPGSGMWLDLNRLFDDSHHVAALLSIQGINPISARPVDGYILEQYKHRCPEHNRAFQGERYCQDCGYAWTPQNYLSTRGTPRGYLWLARVRQFLVLKRQNSDFFPTNYP